MPGLAAAIDITPSKLSPNPLWPLNTSSCGMVEWDQASAHPANLELFPTFRANGLAQHWPWLCLCWLCAVSSKPTGLHVELQALPQPNLFHLGNFHCNYSGFSQWWGSCLCGSNSIAAGGQGLAHLSRWTCMGKCPTSNSLLNPITALAWPWGHTLCQGGFIMCILECIPFCVRSSVSWNYYFWWNLGSVLAAYYFSSCALLFLQHFTKLYGKKPKVGSSVLQTSVTRGRGNGPNLVLRICESLHRGPE